MMSKGKRNAVAKGLKEPPLSVGEQEAGYILQESRTGGKKQKKETGTLPHHSTMAVIRPGSGRRDTKEMIHPREAAPILSARGRNESNMTALEKMDLIEEGISKKALESFKEKAQLDYDQLAECLNVARATLINKKGEEKFNRDVSDKIVSLVDIYSYGYQVFEDRGRFNEWIFRPNKALGNRTPFHFMHNSFGRQEVKNLIGRIDHGIYS
jgi:putative toxin-antitoxin system antitoxin component (TIGR02293 family)